MSTTTLRRNRRPPRDPSAALRPKNALEQAAMKSFQFRQKVQQANATSICNSTSDRVGRMPMRRLLAMDKFCVPIFQRRYCWTETQWRTLLEDAAGRTDDNVNRKQQQQHSLGRLTCTRTGSSLVGVEGRSCILDGQQRFTTTTILLAAIRDLLQTLQGDGDAFAGTLQSIQQLLFSDWTQMQEWTQQQIPLVDGVELPFARLVPTFCDRKAYYTAILPVRGERHSTHNQLQGRPLQAKQFFLDELKQNYNSFPKLTKLLRGILDGLTMLYFPIDLDTNHNDGTDDLMVVYERLALRDATFCKPNREEEYKSMDGTDMIRNLLLGSFSSESDALGYYLQYWLPLEQLVATHNAGDDGFTTMSILQAFLESQQRQDKPHEGASSCGVIGGQIYADFQAWFAARLSHSDGDNSTVEKEEKGATIEEKVNQVGNNLLDFARTMERSVQDEA